MTPGLAVCASMYFVGINQTYFNFDDLATCLRQYFFLQTFVFKHMEMHQDI
jgi:hypothetical protein